MTTLQQVVFDRVHYVDMLIEAGFEEKQAKGLVGFS